MINIEPQSELRICNVPILSDYKNQLTFSSVTNQQNYFISKANFAMLENDFTYIRKDDKIVVEQPIDSLFNCNYLMYRNNGFTNKYFYAFITDLKYVSENSTAIYFKTDSFQTWYFDYTLKPSFVEREHVSDDTIGANLISENVQLGEYISNKKYQWLNDSFSSLYTNSNFSIVLGATSLPDGTIPGDSPGTQTDGIYAGIRFYCFKNQYTGDVSDNTGIEGLNFLIKNYASAGKSDAIKYIFMVPKFVTNGAENRTDHLYAGSNTTINYYINHGTTNNKTLDISNNEIDNYTPINKKLLTYPYNYLLCSNNSGTEVIYKYEDFYIKDNDNNKQIVTPSFIIQSCMTPSGSIRMIPFNYKGIDANDLEGINLGKFPICSWDSDVYTNYLTQQAVNIPLSVISSLISAGAGVMAGNAIGVASGIVGVANTIGEVYKESLIPPQCEGNINCGDVITASGNNDFHFQCMSIKNQFAKIIDNYFSMFGYKCNLVKVPNINNRQNWNYVKTMDCNLSGNLPQSDAEVIKNIFNNGVTLWHNPSTFGDYAQSNNII